MESDCVQIILNREKNTYVEIQYKTPVRKIRITWKSEAKIEVHPNRLILSRKSIQTGPKGVKTHKKEVARAKEERKEVQKVLFGFHICMG